MSGHAVNHAVLNVAGVPLLGVPGIELRCDHDLVTACLALGGFPRAERRFDGTEGREVTVWVGPDGQAWTGWSSAVKTTRKGRKVR